ncbi:zinc metalloprotease [Tautonia rosea]|uniref:hypothetical protein n=1 Tax=Tautonia rosea TaxID=2728037 RepID=UPI0014751B69|nr:hypothetical protein [Tautonia rosea]
MVHPINGMLPVPCTAEHPIEQMGAHGQLRAGALSSTLWDRPKRGPVHLNVVFLDGHPTVQSLVKRHVRDWEDAANVKFNFLSRDRFVDAHLRITMPTTRIFQSYLGTGSVLIDRRLPSMTLGFTDDVLANPNEVKRLILHEFGHALGLIHEHQNPRGGLIFKVPEVYDYFWQNHRWDQRTVREQVIQPTRVELLKNATQFDPKSIMLYAFPASILAGGPVSTTQLNHELSEGDRRYIASIYPKGSVQPPPSIPAEPTGYLPLNLGEPYTGTLPIRGAEIPFGFQIASPGRYLMETFTPAGSREEYWVLTLRDARQQVLADDHHGSSPNGLNALIERELTPGHYRLHLRHRLRSGLGAYGILVRKAG